MDRKMFQNIGLVLLAMLVLFSCKKDKPNPDNKNLPGLASSKVLIVCEGSLGNGNAGLSVYDPAKDSVYNDVFNNANGQALGDIFQSIYKHNNQYFLCVNNSDKITIVNSQSWLQIATISISKPRYILPVNNQKAYVGSLFSNKIYVINPTTYAVEKEIKMPFQNVEQMLLKDGFAYVCCWDTACNKIYKINTTTDELTDSISLAGAAPQSILMDKENKVWVFGGNAYKGKNTNLNQVDISSGKLIKSFVFPNDVEAIKPAFNPGKDSLYFLEVNYSGGVVNNGVFRMPTTATSLPEKAFISCKTNQYFWALGIDPLSGNIYVGDPKGFIQKGSITIYNQHEKVKKEFNVGLGVSSFYFD